MTRTCDTCRREDCNCTEIHGPSIFGYTQTNPHPNPLLKYTQEEVDAITKFLLEKEHKTKKHINYQQERYTQIDNPPPTPPREPTPPPQPWIKNITRTTLICNNCRTRLANTDCDTCFKNFTPGQRIFCNHKKYSNATKHTCENCNNTPP